MERIVNCSSFLSLVCVRHSIAVGFKGRQKSLPCLISMSRGLGSLEFISWKEEPNEIGESSFTFSFFLNCDLFLRFFFYCYFKFLIKPPTKLSVNLFAMEDYVPPPPIKPEKMFMPPVIFELLPDSAALLFSVV